jgi:uncharacterized phage infection (PIP) family protein YhgE
MSILNYLSGGQAGSGATDILDHAGGMLDTLPAQANQYLKGQSQLFQDELPFLDQLQQSQMAQYQHPQATYDDIMAGYTRSPQTQQRLTSLTNQMQNQAEASGMMGSSDFFQNLGQNLNKVMQKGRDDYFKKVSGLRHQGFDQAAQLGGHLFDTGAQGQQLQSQNIMDALRARAQIAQARAQAQAQESQGIARGIGNAIEGVATIAKL